MCVDSEIGVDPMSIVFGSANWMSSVSVSVWAVEDRVDEDDEEYTVSHSSTSSDSFYEGSDVLMTFGGTVAVTVKDDDTAGVLVTAVGGVRVDEGVASASTYLVSLGSDPDESNGHGTVSDYAVVVSVSLDSVTDVSVSVGSSLTFTTSDWSVGQSVSVSAVSDDVSESDVESFVLSHVTTSTSGTKYGGGVSWSPRDVHVIDDATPPPYFVPLVDVVT